MASNPKFSPETQQLLSSNDAENLDSDRYMESLSDRILELEEEILALKRRRNPCARINRLPPEVLAQIILALSGLKSPRKPGVKQSRYHWVRASHVCHYWREVALGCSVLWCDITDASLAYPGLVEAMIHRSKGSLLTVDATMIKELEATEAIITVLQQHTHRMRVLKLKDGHAGIISLTRHIWHASVGKWAPFLEDLSLSASYYRNPPELPPHFFIDGCPLIQRLDLFGFTVRRWKELPLGAGLTHLRIATSERNSAHDRPPLNEFMECLARMQGLKELDLAWFLPDVTSPSPAQSDLVIFPDLRRLRLADTNDRIARFLHPIRFPRPADVEIIFGENPDAWNVKQVLKALKTSWCGFRTRDKKGGTSKFLVNSDNDKNHFFVETLDIKTYQAHYPDIGERLPRLEFLFFGKRGELAIQHDFDGREDHNIVPGATVSYLQDFSAHFNLLSLKTLGFFASDPLPDEAWNSVFAQLPLLETIDFRVGVLGKFFDWLADDPAYEDTRDWVLAHPGLWRPDGSANTDTPEDLATANPADDNATATASTSSIGRPGVPTKMPSLARINFKSVYIGGNPLHDAIGMRTDDLMDSIVLAFEKRDFMQYPIQELNVECCDWFTQSDYDRMVESFPDLNMSWDQFEGEYGDLEEGEEGGAYLGG